MPRTSTVGLRTAMKVTCCTVHWPHNVAPKQRPYARLRATTDAASVANNAVAGSVPELPGGFCIEAGAVQQLLEQHQCSIDTLLLMLLKPAAKLARPPISNYHVGAVGLAGSGNIYIGGNLEFPGAPLNQSVHAEQFLVANLLVHGEQRLDTLAISAAPCGHCRQFYSEMVCADSVRFLFGSHDSPEEPHEYSLSELLPARFGPLDLLEDVSAPLLLEPQDNRLKWAASAQRELLRAGRGDGALGRAAEAAFEAAQRSYAPYTRCPSGAAIVTRGGGIFTGSYVENAAYNPGLHPLQAAVVAAIIGGIGGYDEIEQVVVAELSKGLVCQEGVVSALARAASGKPDLPVTALHVEWAE